VTEASEARTARTWVIVGTGRIAKRMAGAILAVGDRVVAVVGRTPARAEEFASALGLDAVGVDRVASLADVGVPEFAYIASPNNLHAQHVAEAAELGIHVLCEKPLAMSAAESAEVRDAFPAEGPKLGVAFQYRQYPAYREARAVIASGALGDLRLISVTTCLGAIEVPAWYDEPAESGGGIMPMSAVHRVDLLRFLVDREFVTASAMTSHYRGRPFDDTAGIVATMTGGVLVTIVTGLDAPYGADRIEVHGSAGSVVLSTRWYVDGEKTLLEVRTADGVQASAFDRVDNYELEVADFARYVVGASSEFASPADGVAASRFIEAVYAAARSDRAVEVAADHG